MRLSAKKIILALAVCASTLTCLAAKNSPLHITHFLAYYNTQIERIPNPEFINQIIFGPARINKDFSLEIMSEKKLADIVSLKESFPELKITLLIGGVRSANFSEAAATEQSRAKFLDSLGAAMEKYNLDGVDFDWEFPSKVDAATGQNGTPQDVENYTLLMRDFKARFPEKILTVDVGNEVEHIDLAACHKYVDKFNLMSYDYSSLSHNAPLYPTIIKRNNYVSKSVDKMLALVPPEKISMGIPFYGRRIVSRNGDNPQMFYRDIVEYAKRHELVLCRDEIARSPFYLDAKMRPAIMFDDETSIREKCRYAREKKLGGVSVWQSLGDDDSFTLSRATAEECRAKKKKKRAK